MSEVDWVNQMAWVQRIFSFLPEQNHEDFISNLLTSIEGEGVYSTGDEIADFYRVSSHIQNALADMGFSSPITRREAGEYEYVLVFSRDIVEGEIPPSSIHPNFCEILNTEEEKFTDKDNFFVGINLSNQ